VQCRPGPQGALPLHPLVPPVLKLLTWNISAIVVSGNAAEIKERRGDGDSITAEDAVNHSRGGGSYKDVLQVRAEGEAKQGRYHGVGLKDDSIYLQLLAGEFVV